MESIAELLTTDDNLYEHKKYRTKHHVLISLGKREKLINYFFKAFQFPFLSRRVKFVSSHRKRKVKASALREGFRVLKG